MALKDLTTEQMVLVSGAWLDPKRDRANLEALPKVKPLLVELGEAHAGLVTSSIEDTTLATELGGIQKKQVELDRTHDRKARGSTKLLEAYADLTDDPNEAAHYIALRDSLAPDGLRFITASYSDEAGNASLTKSRLTKDHNTALKKVPSPTGSLHTSVHQWFGAGDQLGKLELSKAKLKATILAQPDEDPKPNELQARTQWIRIVNGVIHMIELSKLTAEKSRAIMAPLDAELAKPARREPAEAAPEAAAAPEADPAPKADPAPGDGGAPPA